MRRIARATPAQLGLRPCPPGVFSHTDARLDADGVGIPPSKLASKRNKGYFGALAFGARARLRRFGFRDRQLPEWSLAAWLSGRPSKAAQPRTPPPPLVLLAKFTDLLHHRRR